MPLRELEAKKAPLDYLSEKRRKLLSFNKLFYLIQVRGLLRQLLDQCGSGMVLDDGTTLQHCIGIQRSHS